MDDRMIPSYTVHRFDLGWALAVTDRCHETVPTQAHIETAPIVPRGAVECKDIAEYLQRNGYPEVRVVFCTHVNAEEWRKIIKEITAGIQSSGDVGGRRVGGVTGFSAHWLRYIKPIGATTAGNGSEISVDVSNPKP